MGNYLFINGRPFSMNQCDLAIVYAQNLLKKSSVPVSVRELGGYDCRTRSINDVISLIEHQILVTGQMRNITLNTRKKREHIQ